MAKNDNLKDFLTDVADAIREKKGTTDLINPQDFSAEIASIQSGGGAVAVSAKAVNFRDYDGTILHSYTKDEFLALTELPPLPTREGLICQEWNWDFADAVEYVTNYGVLEVGATYITDDGKTRLYITIAAEGRMDVPLCFQQDVANGVTIDWGDGSATETLSGTGKVNTMHHYNAIGDYVISLEVADGCVLRLGHNTDSINVLGKNSGETQVYCNMLRKVAFGRIISIVSSSSFNRCRALSSVILPNNIVTLEGTLFNYSRLGALVIPKNIRVASGLYDCQVLSFVSLPKGLTEINSYTFNRCYALSQLIIPKTVAKIGSNAFYECGSIAYINIPNAVTQINSSTFYRCYGMRYYDFSALLSVPSLSSTSAFSSIPSDCKIIVPDALYDEWIAATNWSTYASYIIKKSEWDALNA